MSRGLRLTEQWMGRALWLIAIVFAAFLIGLGGRIVEKLGDLAPAPSAEQFVDAAKAGALQEERARAQAALRDAHAALEQAEQKHEVAQASTKSARDTFDNWIATRHATVRPDQDEELISRTRALDALAAAERTALGAVEAQKQAELDARQASERVDEAMERLMEPAREAAYAAARRAALQAFGYRLALTLPLLLVAGWLFKHKRKSTYWPFAWGFIFFALFAFFFELVPYLPSYGGYVRYGVGIVLTVLVGRYAIVWLQGYLARQKAAEALPDSARKQTMRYETALHRIAKNRCPSCERATDFKDASLAHCPHCGIRLFERCTSCSTRKNAFTRFCFSCGTPANLGLPD
jgi:predicted RNA-binding Zn-ribbon protein involved in translation (DUF1610 family)